MKTNIIIGLVLIFVSITDLILGLLVVGPRVAPEAKKIVVGSLIGGSIVCFTLGFLFLAGVF